MAFRRNLLSARGVSTVAKPGRHSDGGNLYLNVSPSGAKSWVFLYRFGGRQREMGLGTAGADDVTLAKAREAASFYRQELREGRDPLATRAKPKEKTFGELADAYVEDMRPSWRNQKHGDQWQMTLVTYAASLRPLSITEVDTGAVLEVLKPLWTTKPETASRVRGRIESVLDAARAKGLRLGDNPARWRGHLDQLLPKRQKLTRGHHSALPYAEVPNFMGRLMTAAGMAVLALQFTILTAARTGEVIGARWDEFDLDAGLWIVPAERMKAGREHRVPIVGRAHELVACLAETRGGPFVFPGGREEQPLSNVAMNMALRRLKVDVTTHGFRSSFRDWAAEQTNTPHEVAEMALAHTIKSAVERAYRRGDLFEKRRELMMAWSLFCSGEANANLS